MPSFVTELGRRNVIRVGIAYVVASWLVLQVLDLVLENIGAPDWVMQTIMVLLAIGLPFVLAFAWAFEITPDGIKREVEVDRSESISTNTGKKLDRLIIVVLILMVALLGVERLWISDDELAPAVDQAAIPDPAEASTKSIAVLPFADLSQAQDQEWFGDGLSEEILNALTRTPDLLVASRTSSFKYKQSGKDVREIADELGVAHVLEGSIRRAGDDIRVTAQLIRASDGFHVWSQNYDRQMKDVISIQENLALEIARALETGMDPEALESMMRMGTRSIAAYEHFINGLALSAKAVASGDVAYYVRAYEEFERARDEDPEFAVAHDRAARFWAEQLRLIARLNAGLETPIAERAANYHERMSLAIKHAPDEITRRAFEGQLAYVQLELRKAITLLRQVVEERPNDSYSWQSLMQAATLATDIDALEYLIARTVEMAELNPAYGGWAALAAFHLNRPEDSIRVARSVLAMHPDHREVVYQAHRTLLWAGQTEEAAALLPSMVDDGWYPTAQIRQACAEGNRALAERIHASAPLRTLGSAWHRNMLLGDTDAAFAVLQSVPEQRIPFTRATWLLYPHFDPTPFPDLMAIIERENIDRPPAVSIPFGCPPE